MVSLSTQLDDVFTKNTLIPKVFIFDLDSTLWKGNAHQLHILRTP
eukprot:UN10439